MSTERLGPDPLDPHGDGSIRPGDPLWDAMMSNETIHATRSCRDPNEWDVTRLPAIGGGDESADRVDRNPPLVPGRRDYTPAETGKRWRAYLLACLIGAGFYTTLWLLYQWVTP